VSLDATAAAEAVHKREVSPVELVEQALAAIEEKDAEINAFTVVLADEARERARELERDPRGPLAGVPIAIKDHVWMRGAPATNGSLALRDFYPDVDAACVERLREAGAVIVGKTNNPEFCYRGITDNAVYGLTRNPHNLDRTPGGSSGGSAAAVAADMVPFALGTDGGGSIRIPASFCGIAGLKPTFGLIPKLPGFRGWPTLSVDGPLARTVRDLALTLGVMAGASPADDLTWPVPLDERDALRVAHSQDLGFAPVEPSVRRAFDETIAKLGWSLEEAHPPPIPPTALWNAIALPEGYASEGPLLAEHEHQMTEGTAEIVRAGAATSAAEYLDAQHERSLYTRAWAEFFDDYDLLLIPTMQLTAFPVGMLSPQSIDGQPLDQFFDDWCTFCVPANLTGQPAASVPIGTDEAGLPIGLQIIGRRWEDLTVLAAAAAVERLLP
jgi:Asp-tRNA(Asn)/Glu-tRNA(Gln) amidotransferase A subunit family amidase